MIPTATACKLRAYMCMSALSFLLAQIVHSLRLPEQQTRMPPINSPTAAHGHACSTALNTFYLSASEASVRLLRPGRPGTTRLIATLREQDVSRFTPVVTASAKGLVHDVADTWRFLKVSTQRAVLCGRSDCISALS